MSRELVRFDPRMSDEVRAAIEPYLIKWAFLIPAWCHELNVSWIDDDTNGALEIVVHYEYRRADLHILPNFLSSSHRREANVVHELLHIVTEPMRNTQRDMRAVICKDRPEMLAWADEMIRHASESVTCDLTALVMERFP